MKNSQDTAFLRYFLLFIVPIILVFREYYFLFTISGIASIYIFSKTKLYALVSNKVNFYTYLTVAYCLSGITSFVFHWQNVDNIYEVVVVIAIGVSTLPIYKKYRENF